MKNINLQIKKTEGSERFVCLSNGLWKTDFSCTLKGSNQGSKTDQFTEVLKAVHTFVTSCWRITFDYLYLVLGVKKQIFTFMGM